MSETRALVERLHELFNTRRFEDLGEVLAEDVLMVVEGTSLRGLTAVRDYLAGMMNQIPIHVETKRVLVDSGDTIVHMSRIVDNSPATSEPAPDGASPAAIATYLVVNRIAAGRIAEWRTYRDSAPAVQESESPSRQQAGIHRLMCEQAALRRVATLVARGASESEVLDAVVSEAAGLFDEEALLVRYRIDDAAAIIVQAGASNPGELLGLTVGTEDRTLAQVRGSVRPTRIDSYVDLVGPGAEVAHTTGITASVSAPLVVQGKPWGRLVLVSRAGPLPAGIEDRLAQFADLAATAIANAQSRAELQALADEQAALRRVAELVARGSPTQQVFDQVTAEASRLLDDTPTLLERYERSGTEAVIVAESPNRVTEQAQVGARFPVVGEIVLARVWRTGRPARIDDYDGVPGAETIPRGIRATVSAPIAVEGQLWGVLCACTSDAPLPACTEERLARFCELVAVAIANAETRAELTASRARIVASADEARRRLARDVHDGAQQRLVHTLITLKQARAALQDSNTAAARLLAESLAQAEAANGQLRELANGILPTALAHGGLRGGVESLLRDTPLPVDAEVLHERLPEPVETTGYFVIAEALTNVIKHAGANRARVRAITAEDRLEVEVADDGRGGADPAGGCGLIGLSDRVNAAGGTMSVSSQPGAGTRVTVALPLDQSEMRERP